MAGEKKKKVTVSDSEILHRDFLGVFFVCLVVFIFLFYAIHMGIVKITSFIVMVLLLCRYFSPAFNGHRSQTHELPFVAHKLSTNERKIYFLCSVANYLSYFSGKWSCCLRLTHTSPLLSVGTNFYRSESFTNPHTFL